MSIRNFSVILLCIRILLFLVTVTKKIVSHVAKHFIYAEYSNNIEGFEI